VADNLEQIVPTVLLLCTRSTMRRKPSAAPAYRVVFVVSISFGTATKRYEPIQPCRLRAPFHSPWIVYVPHTLAYADLGPFDSVIGDRTASQVLRTYSRTNMSPRPRLQRCWQGKVRSAFDYRAESGRKRSSFFCLINKWTECGYCYGKYRAPDHHVREPLARCWCVA